MLAVPVNWSASLHCDGLEWLQEQEMEKQQQLFEQSRLADRGAAEMVLLYISASRGEQSGDDNCGDDVSRDW